MSAFVYLIESPDGRLTAKAFRLSPAPQGHEIQRLNPMSKQESTDQAIERLLTMRTIAVVGLSDDPSRPSHSVSRFVQSKGRRIVPVNPNLRSVLGETCYPRLEDIPILIDMVNVFRRPEYCPDIARSAASIGAKGLWLQLGIVSDEARQIAEKAGVTFVQDRCIQVELAQRE
jgi:predicted CoA-binding protein